MKEKILQKIISYFREEMTTGSTAGSPGFSNLADPGGPVAGYDVPLGKKKKKAPIIARGLMTGSRSRWKRRG